MEISRRKAFTLIELLVVIAIIGILSTLFFIGMRTVKAKARDTSRKVDIREIAKGLLSYAIENGDKYPVSVGADDIEELASAGVAACGSADTSTAAALKTGGNIDYVPCDKFTNTKYKYWSDGGNFIVETKLETRPDTCYQAITRNAAVDYVDAVNCLGFTTMVIGTAPTWKHPSLKLKATYSSGTPGTIRLKWQPGAIAAEDMSPITYKVTHTFPDATQTITDKLVLGWDISTTILGVHSFKVCAVDTSGAVANPCLEDSVKVE